MARRMDAQFGEGQLSLFEVDRLPPPSTLGASSHHPPPTNSPSVLSRQGRERPGPTTPRPDSSAADSLLSPEDVARRCGLSRKAVYRAVARGELRAARMLSRLRIDPRDVEMWIGANIIDAGCPTRAASRRRLPASNGLRRLLPEP